MLMLTSGSTGESKAVCITHEQALAAVKGKSAIVDLLKDGTFLNWIGMDHVAGIIEGHLQPLYLGVDQIQVAAADVISDPPKFFELIERHNVTRSFAPNFFLANLTKAMESSAKSYNLSSLRCLMSGGESNPTKTVAAFDEVLRRYGAPPNVLIPGFGMTETCAGSIYNTQCPTFDLTTGMEFASLGHCIPGAEMRVVSNGQNGATESKGRLQIRGPVVFKSYYNNPTATSEAFTPDGWFDTGDEGLIDASGALHITGRIKDTIRINGVGFLPGDIEASLIDAQLPGVVPSYYAAFSWRPAGAETERLAVTYLPSYSDKDVETRVQARVETTQAITKVVMLQTGICPYVLPLDRKIMQKSTLGKLSRGKIKTAFLNGALTDHQDRNEEVLYAYNRSGGDAAPANELEKTLLEIFRASMAREMDLPEHMLNVETPYFDIGVTSIHLILLKKQIEERLGIEDLPILLLMTNSTIRALAAAIEDRNKPKEYDPVVKLRDTGDKAPLWLVHPGVGEVLVFINLSKYLTDRPVYALRARGFEEGETRFENIDDAVTTYYNAIKKHQPNGPYALAGYSYGTMLAFETSKRLEAAAEGQQVQFLGSFNLPPHIKERMRQLDWGECVLHLAYFLDLITEARSRELAPIMAPMSREEKLATIMDEAIPGRMEELSLTPVKFMRWADVAYGLQSMAQHYEPTGSVPQMDIFYCTPLAIVASSRADWMERYMRHWVDFTQSAKFHEVDGEHYTMIAPQNLISFQRTFKGALADRGL